MIIAHRANVYSTTGAASYATTGTYTPAADSLLVALVVGTGDTNDPNHAAPFAGHGVSWSKLPIAANDISTTHAVSVWVANAGSSPTSAACTAQWTTNRTGAAIIEYEITGADLSGGATAAIIQHPTNAGTGTSASLTLDPASGSENRPLAFFVHLWNEATTPRAGWTEDAGADGSFNNPRTGAAGQYRSDAFETTASASWSANVAWRGVALEIAAASALSLSLGVGALALSGQSVGVGTTGPSTGTLAIAGQAPAATVSGAGSLVVPAGAVTLSGQTPALAVGSTNPSLAIPAGAITLAGQAPTPGLSGGVVSIPAATLTLSGQSAGVGFTGPSAGALAIAGAAPSISQDSPGGGVTLFTPVGAVTLSGTYVEVLFLGPDTGVLTLTGQVPAISASVKPVPVGAVLLTGRTPAILTSAGVPVGTLTITGLPASLLQPGPGILGIPDGALALAGLSPTLAFAGGDQTAVVPAGTLTLSGRTPALAVNAGTFAIVIDGVSRSFLAGSLTLTDEINARNTLAVSFWDESGTWHPSCGESVVLYSGTGTRIFSGTIDEPVEESLLGQSTGYKIHLTAVDQSQFADRHLVAEAYDNASFSAIVADLVSTYLAADGVTVGTVDAGPTFVRKVFNYRSVADVFNELSEDTGYSWWIDADTQLHFRERTAVVAPITVTSTNRTAERFTVRTSRGAYRNRQYIRAGRDLTDPIPESFKGDGTRQTFSVGFPIGQEPTITLNGVAQTIGIRGVEDDAAFQWYWNKDSNEITQRAAGVPLTVSDALVITFRGLFPILIQAQDNTEIADRQSVEGGSGLYEAIEDIQDIESADLAFDTAIARLQRNGMIRQTIQFETTEDGLAAGQILPVLWPSHQIDGDYLVQSVRAHDVGASFLRYSVTALNGDAVGGWIAFYQRLMAVRRGAVQRENELLLLLRGLPENVIAGDALLVETPVARETRIGLAQIGRSEIGVT